MDIKHDMYEVADANDEYECAKQCRSHDHCEFFTYIPQDKYCSLRWLLIGQPYKSDYVPPLVSGYRSCKYPVPKAISGKFFIKIYH